MVVVVCEGCFGGGSITAGSREEEELPFRDELGKAFVGVGGFVGLSLLSPFFVSSIGFVDDAGTTVVLAPPAAIIGTEASTMGASMVTTNLVPECPSAALNPDL